MSIYELLDEANEKLEKLYDEAKKGNEETSAVLSKIEHLAEVYFLLAERILSIRFSVNAIYC